MNDLKIRLGKYESLSVEDAVKEATDTMIRLDINTREKVDKVKRLVVILSQLNSLGCLLDK